MRSKWSAENLAYLEDSWGRLSLSTICKNLGRTENAVKLKVTRLGLGAFLENGEYVTFHQLLKCLGYYGAGEYIMISWIKNRGFPLKTKRVNKCSFKVVYLEDFWKWLEENRDFVDISKFEKHALGAEPNWVEAQRKHDFNLRQKYKTTPWERDEDARLSKLIGEYKYTYLELSKILGRTSGAIQRRLCDLKIKGRPLKSNNHVKWTASEYNVLGEFIKSGMSYELMSENLNKSSKALRGRVYEAYGTERLDAVRKIMGNGNFGDGRPTISEIYQKFDNLRQMDVFEIAHE